MMIGSEDSRSPLGRPSSLVPPMTLQPLHSMCSGAVSPPQCASRLARRLRVTARLLCTLSLQCSGALLANLCPAHSHTCGECVWRNSLELRARHCRAKVHTKFRTSFRPFEEQPYHLSELRVQLAKKVFSCCSVGVPCLSLLFSFTFLFLF